MNKEAEKLKNKADEHIAYLKGYERGLRDGSELATDPSKAMATLMSLGVK